MVSQKAVSCRVNLKREGEKKKGVGNAKVYRSQAVFG